MKIHLLFLSVFFASRAIAGEFLGFSSDPVQGNAGIGAMNQTCVNTYGAGTKFCSSKDIILSRTLPTQSDQAWVAPFIIGSAPDYQFSGLMVLDYSGLTAGSTAISCDAWSSNFSNRGGLVTIGAKMSFGVNPCNNLNPVACCEASDARWIAPN